MNLDVRCDTRLLTPLIARIQVFPMVSTSDYTVPLVFVLNYIFLGRYNRIVEYEWHASLIQIENAVEKIINGHSVPWVQTGIFVPQQLVDLLCSLSLSELQLLVPPLVQDVIPKRSNVLNVVESSLAFQQIHLSHDLNFLDS